MSNNFSITHNDNKINLWCLQKTFSRMTSGRQAAVDQVIKDYQLDDLGVQLLMYF